jgi:glycerol-3-phosphate cytidylyltransferase
MANKQIVVLAAGVWDLFHIGHLNLLRNAKGLGDKLIVAVSTDECVLEWKRKKPVIPYQERAEIVRSIKYVDCVVPQYSYDKTKLLQTLKPDILVAGDDWDKLKGQEILEEMGGKVIFFPYTRTISTTELIERIKTYGPPKKLR